LADELDAAREACDSMPVKVRPIEREIQESALAFASLCEDIEAHSSNNTSAVIGVSPTRDTVDEAQRRLDRFSLSVRTLADDVTSAIDRRLSLEAQGRRKEEEEARRADWVERTVALDDLVRSSEEELERLKAHVQSPRAGPFAPADNSDTASDPQLLLLSAKSIEAFSATQIDPIQTCLDELSADMRILSPRVDSENAAVLALRVEAVARLRARLVEIVDGLETTKIDNEEQAERQLEQAVAAHGQNIDDVQIHVGQPERTEQRSHSNTREVPGTGPGLQLTVTSTDGGVEITEDEEEEASSQAATDAAAPSSTPTFEDLDSVAIADFRAGLDGLLPGLGLRDGPPAVIPHQPTLEQVKEAEGKIHELQLTLDTVARYQGVAAELRAELESKSDIVARHRLVAEFSSAANSLDDLMSNLLESIDRAEGTSDKSYFRNSLRPAVHSGSASPLSDTSVPLSSPDHEQLSNALARVTSQLEKVEAVAALLEGHAWITTHIGRLRTTCGEMTEMARDRLERQPPSLTHDSSGSRSETSGDRPRTLSNASSQSVSPSASRRRLPSRSSLPKRVPSYSLNRRQTVVPRSASTGSARSIGSSSCLSQLALPLDTLHLPSTAGSAAGLGDAVGVSRPENGHSPGVLRRMSSAQSLVGQQKANRYRSDKRAVDRVIGRVVNELNVRVHLISMVETLPKLYDRCRSPSSLLKRTIGMITVGATGSATPSRASTFVASYDRPLVWSGLAEAGKNLVSPTPASLGFPSTCTDSFSTLPPTTSRQLPSKSLFALVRNDT
jgi:hypothetical protein